MGVWSGMKTWFIFHFLWGYMFIASSLLLCCLMLLTYILVWPFNRILYRKIVLNLAYMSWCQFTCLTTWWSNTEVEVFMEDERDIQYFGYEHSLVLANHKYESEWLMCWVIAEKYGLLGSCKVFGKAMLKHMPLIGWMWQFCDCIFLRREWEKDKKTIINDLQYISEYPDGYHITLLLYAEGTRLTEGKHQKSNEFARSRGIPELKHHLLPRTKGFTLTMQGIRDQIPAIYDFEGVFLADSAPPTLSSLIQGRRCHAQFYIRRFPTADVPDDPEQSGEWLHNLFREKDEIFDDFHRNGKFTKGTKLELPKRYLDLVVCVFWFVTLCVPLIIYMFNVFVSGSWMLKLGMLALMGGVSLTIKLLVGVSEIKKGSSYGIDGNSNKKAS